MGEAVDRFRAGELDACAADEVIFQYSRAAKESSESPTAPKPRCWRASRGWGGPQLTTRTATTDDSTGSDLPLQDRREAQVLDAERVVRPRHSASDV
jgi:hypothetical protein